MASQAFSLPPITVSRGDASTDFVLVCDGREFRVHRSLLCERIFAFKVAFDECIAKRAEKRAPIYTTKADILDRFLDAMYTSTYSDKPSKPVTKQDKSDKATAGADPKAQTNTAKPADPEDPLLEQLKINVGVLAVAYRYNTYEVRQLATRKYTPQLHAWTQSAIHDRSPSKNPSADLVTMIATIYAASPYLNSAAFEDFFHSLLLLSSTTSLAETFPALHAVNPRLEALYADYVWSTWMAISQRALEHAHMAAEGPSTTLLARTEARVAAVEAGAAAVKEQAGRLAEANEAMKRRANGLMARRLEERNEARARLRACEDELADLRARTVGLLDVTMPCALCGGLAQCDLRGSIACCYVVCEAGHRFMLPQGGMVQAERGGQIEEVGEGDASAEETQGEQPVDGVAAPDAPTNTQGTYKSGCVIQ